MQTTTMSITRALATLKAQKADIDAFFAGKPVFMAVTKGGTGVETSIAGQNKAEASATIQSTNDRIQGLLTRQISIKKAIADSNLNTFVTVNGRSITVAEAIIVKNNLPLQVQLLGKLRESYKNSQIVYNEIRTAVDTRVDSLIKHSVTESSSPEQNASLSASIRQTQEAELAPSYIDPLQLFDQIEKLSAEISFIRNELDFTLSESNTTTQIVVEM